MIWCKCIQKIRDEKGIIQEYEVVDFNKQHRIVSKDVLKAAIESGELSVVNLRLTKDGKLVNRSTNAEAVLMAKLTTNIVTQEDLDAKANAELMGLSATVVDRVAVQAPNSPSVLITADVFELSMGINLKNKNVTFIGNNPVCNIHYAREAREIIIKNPTLLSNVYSHSIMSPVIKLSIDNTDSKILDIIFKTYKTDESGNYVWFNNEAPLGKLQLILLDRRTLNQEEALDKMRKILARQKPSSKSDRRCYDIIAYLRLMYSLYISYDDNRFLYGAEEYINEYTSKLKSALWESSQNAEFVSKTQESLKLIIGNIRNQVPIRGY